LVAINQIEVIVGEYLLDQSTTDKSVEYIQQGIRLNLHCWHTDEHFSKFAFKLGQYNQTELEIYRNDTTAQAYVSDRTEQKLFYLLLFKAMRMALESKYMTLEELAAYRRNS
jgi:hypothetical protein